MAAAPAGGMDPAISAQVTTLLSNPNLSDNNRRFLMSQQFAGAATAMQQATLTAYAQQAATAAAQQAAAAAAPAPAAALTPVQRAQAQHVQAKLLMGAPRRPHKFISRHRTFLAQARRATWGSSRISASERLHQLAK